MDDLTGSLVSTPSGLLFPHRPGLFVNPRCVVHEYDGLRVAMVDGSPFHTWAIGDVVGENLFVVQARQAQVATIIELAEALDRSERSLFLAFKQYAEGGAAAVMPKRRGPAPGTGRDALRDAMIRRLHEAGLSGRGIAEQLKTSPLTVTRALARMGLETNIKRQRRLALELREASAEPSAEAPASEVAPTEATAASASTTEPLPTAAEPSAASDSTVTAEVVGPPADQHGPTSGTGAVRAEAHPVEAVVPSLDPDPLNRWMDRLLASQGKLHDATPLFASGHDLPYAGVLLAVPGLVASGVLVEARRLYPNIGAAFYGPRTTLVVVILLALLRLKRPEHLKEFSPPDLGRVLGLDRVPEVKTLRRKLHRLAKGPSETLMLAVAQRRLAGREDAIGWMYVDGHVRVYSGKERLPKAHVTRMRISLPAMQDMWVHDGDGWPVLFVTQEAHPSLATALPPVLESVREVTGKRAVTLVFDRGGWSPDLFATLVADGAHVLTYRKGPSEPVPVDQFAPYGGRPDEKPWLLHQASVRLPNGLWVRQITRLVGVHQTTIITTRQDLPIETLARRMFDRWRQENYFKYMREEYDLDGLVEYGAEDDDPKRDTPNPVWTRRDAALRRARGHHKSALARENNPEHADVLEAAAAVEELRKQRDAVSRRVAAGDLEQPTKRLPQRMKSLYDGLKTIAWQIETGLFNAVAPFYKRNEEEGRTLITAAFHSKGDLQVTERELVVTLAAQSSPHRTRAIAELCKLLDDTATNFPGTHLRLRYRVAAGSPAPETANSAVG